MSEISLTRQYYNSKRPKNIGKGIFKQLQSSKLRYDQTSSLSMRNEAQNFVDKNPLRNGSLNLSETINDIPEDTLCGITSLYPGIRQLVMRNWDTCHAKLCRSLSIHFGSSLESLHLIQCSITNESVEIILTFMSNLRSLSLVACPLISSSCMQFVATSSHHSLESIDFSRNPQLDSAALQFLAGSIGYQSLTCSRLSSVNIDGCSKIDDAGLIALSKISRPIQFLSISDCGRARRQQKTLEYRNSAKESGLISDCGVIPIVSVASHLLYLSLKDIANQVYRDLCGTGITEACLTCLGLSCHQLIHLDLTRSSSKHEITDSHIASIAKGCRNLEFFSLKGVYCGSSLSEASVSCLCINCPNLTTLDLSGCSELITFEGMREAAKFMRYVTPASTFLGFIPLEQNSDSIDHHFAGIRQLKFIDQHEMIESKSAEMIQTAYRSSSRLRKSVESNRSKKRIEAATVITVYFRRYKRRVAEAAYKAFKLENSTALRIQLVFRGRQGRKLAAIQKDKKDAWQSRFPAAINIQSSFRAFHKRKKDNALYSKGKNESVKLVVEKMITKKKWHLKVAVACWLHYKTRISRLKDCICRLRNVVLFLRDTDVMAAIVMQNVGRRWIAKGQALSLRLALEDLKSKRHYAARCIQRFYRAYKGWSASVASSSEQAMWRKRRRKSAILIQRILRGFQAREKAFRMRKMDRLKTYSAIQIQRIFRGTRIMNWKNLKLNKQFSFLMDRYDMEYKLRTTQSRLRFTEYQHDAERDSASDDDGVESDCAVFAGGCVAFAEGWRPGQEWYDGRGMSDPFRHKPLINEWLKNYDVEQKLWYWYNASTNKRDYDIDDETDETSPEPMLFGKEISAVGKRLQVYWPKDEAWYDGTIVRYHKAKTRHRIVYDMIPGEAKRIHEWLDLDKQGSRIRMCLQTDNGEVSWVEYEYFMPMEMISKVDKVEEIERRVDAKDKLWQMLNQWELVQANESDSQFCYWVSKLDGSVRKGTSFSDKWIMTSTSATNYYSATRLNGWKLLPLRCSKDIPDSTGWPCFVFDSRELDMQPPIDPKSQEPQELLPPPRNLSLRIPNADFRLPTDHSCSRSTVVQRLKNQITARVREMAKLDPRFDWHADLYGRDSDEYRSFMQAELTSNMEKVVVMNEIRRLSFVCSSMAQEVNESFGRRKVIAQRNLQKQDRLAKQLSSLLVQANNLGCNVRSSEAKATGEIAINHWSNQFVSDICVAEAALERFQLALVEARTAKEEIERHREKMLVSSWKADG